MTITAKVKMTVEVDVGDHWGPKCDFAQVQRQASESAVADISTAAAKTRGKIRILGKPMVMAVIVTEAQEREWAEHRKLAGYKDKEEKAKPLGRFRIRPLFAWFDLWVGAYWDGKKRALYVLPFPCLGFVVEFNQ
jgi:hypothetical protein